MADDARQLLTLIASGDAQAFTRLYEEWFITVLAQSRHAARGNEHDAAEIAQEVFVKLIRRTPILESNAALGAWFKRAAFTTARDRALSDQRRRAREGARTAPCVDHHEAEARESLAWLRARLDEMEAESRALLSQRFAGGATLARIGALLGLSPGAVDGRINRIIQALRRRSEQPDE